jgi:hypothetical protein
MEDQIMNAFVSTDSEVANPHIDDINTDSHSTSNDYEYAFSDEYKKTKYHITEKTDVTIRQRELEPGINESVMCTVQEICTQMAQVYVNGNTICFASVKRTTTVTCSVTTAEGTSTCTIQQEETQMMTQTSLVNQALEALELIKNGFNPKDIVHINPGKNLNAQQEKIS